MGNPTRLGPACPGGIRGGASRYPAGAATRDDKGAEFREDWLTAEDPPDLAIFAVVLCLKGEIQNFREFPRIRIVNPPNAFFGDD